MSRRSLLGFSLATALAALVPAAALAAPPEGYRVISYRHADGSFASADGCTGTEVFFGSTDAVYGGRPGPVNKQAGPTDVLVIVSDLCAERTTGFAAAAAEPPGGGPLAFWQGQAMVGLQSNAQFTAASVRADVPVIDEVTGASAVAHLDLTWTATGRAVRDPSHLHVRFPGIAVVNSHDNDTLSDATASGTVAIGDLSIQVATPDAHLTSVKAGCQVILHPGVEEADVDCL